MAVVAGVEGLVAAGVHLGQHGLVVDALAARPQPVGVLAVQGWVGAVGAAEVVEPIGVRRAVRRAEGVRAGEDDEVLEVEALGGEDLGEQQDVTVGGRQLVGRLRGAGYESPILQNGCRTRIRNGPIRRYAPIRPDTRIEKYREIMI